MATLMRQKGRLSRVGRISSAGMYVISWGMAVAASVAAQHYSPLIVFFVLFSVSQVIVLTLSVDSDDRRNARVIQSHALAVTMGAMLLTSFLFYYNLGSTLGGNDEAKIYFGVMDSVASVRNGYLPYVHGDWKAHAVPLIALNVVSGAVFPEFESSGSIVFENKLYSVFWNSWIPVVVYFVLRRRFSAKRCLWACIAMAWFPTLLYYGSLGVRDSIVTCGYALFFYLLVSNRRGWTPILQALLVGYIYLLRPESSLFLAGAWVCSELVLAVLFFKTGRSLRLTSLIPFLVAIVVVVGGIDLEQYSGRISDLHEQYSGSARDLGADGSIVNRLRDLPAPVDTLALSAVGLFGVIPPHHQLSSPFIEAGSIDGLIQVYPVWEVSLGRGLKALSSFSWQLCLPFLWLGFVRRRELFGGCHELAVSVCISLAYICVIAQFALDVGKMSAGYPLPIAFSLIVFQESTPRVRWVAFSLSVLFMVVLFAAYFLVKSS